MTNNNNNNNKEPYSNKRREYKAVPLLSGVEEIRQDFEERIAQGDTVYGVEILDDFVETIRKGSLTFILARPNCLSLDQSVLTSKGFIKVGDLTPKHKVYGNDGKLYNIISFIENKNEECYTLTTSDGRQVTVSAEHEWTVNNIKRKWTKLFTTKSLFQYKENHPLEFTSHFSLPEFSGFCYKDKKYIIHPYVLGVLIGDGCLTSGGIVYCKPSLKLFNEVKKYIPSKADIHFLKDNKSVSILNWQEAKEYIKQVGLDTQSYNKFIPEEYLKGSRYQRQMLLQGLLDTDGYQTKSNNEYSTTSLQLAKDIMQLAYSLGYRCTMTSRMGKYSRDGITKETRLNYRIIISNQRNKAAIIIKDITKAPVQNTRCITTDNPEHELIADNYIVTRNCGKSLLGQIIACNLAKQGKKVLICSCEMGSGLLMERQLLNLTGVSMGQLKYLYANRRDMANKILDSVIEDNKYDYLKRIDIAETGGATVDDIMQLLDAEPECDYAIIDYIQRIKGQGSEYENITNAARELQTYARRTGKRLIICSQAKRPNTKDGSTSDASSAAKGSGSIEEDGDVGLLLSEVFENGDKKILATLFKNRYGAKQKTYKYRLDDRLNIKLEEKDYG